MATMNEAILDASIRHQVKVLRFTKGEVERALKLLKKSDAELMARLNGGDLTAWNEAQIRKQLQDIRRLREQVALELKDQVEKQSEEFAANEAQWEMDVISGTSPVALSLTAVAPQVLKTVAGSPINGVPLSGWLGQMVQSDITRVEQAIRLGILQGETKQQMVKRLQGVIDVTQNNASTIVRTAYNHVSNAAKQEVWTQNADILEGVRWSAVLDGRTSPICRSRDGTVYPVDKGPRPPGHPNCRSQVVPVVKGEKIVGDKPFVRDTRTRKEREKDFRAEAKAAAGASWGNLSASERNALVKARRQAWIDENIGTVPSTTTYDAWLRKQPKAFQDEVLGTGRAKLFRDGMTLDKFVDETGKQYTLAELKAETVGDALNVIQPGIGLKAKALLQQGIPSDEVLAMIADEFPDAKTSAGSIASYKAELKKAGLLDESAYQPHYYAGAHITNTVPKVENVVTALENSLPAGVKHAVGGQWVTMAEDLMGAPGVYAHYQSGKGVTLSLKKFSKITATQAQQVLAHELGHLLHKQHQLELPGDVVANLKASAKLLDADGKKLYSYYLTHLDELIAEVYAQAISPSPITSQGILAGKFNEVFKEAIDAAKAQMVTKFPAPPSTAAALQPGAPTSAFTVAGKHTSIGSLAKALLQQGMPDDQVLAAIKAEFPNAKTGLASIASYKSELNKLKKIGGQSGPAVVAQNPIPSKLSPAPPPAVTLAAKETDPLGKLMTQAPAVAKVAESQVKAVGLKLMELGVLDNTDIGQALLKLYPHNKPTPASIATWKSVWKKNNPDAFAKAKAKNVKLTSEVDAAGPTKLPFLYGKNLGTKSTQVLNHSKAKLAAGASHDQVKKFITDEFGGPGVAQQQGVDNLLELAIYQNDTAVAMTKKYINGAVQYTPTHSTPAAAASKAPTGIAVNGKIIPSNKTIANSEDVNNMIEAAVESAVDPAEHFLKLANDKNLLVNPDMFNSLLADFELLETGLGQDMLAAVKNKWNLLPDQPKAKVAIGGPVDMTPSRLASTPYEGRPPPPRYTAAQRAYALKSMSGEGRSPEWAKKVNEKYGLTGDNAITPEEIGIIRSYTGNQTYAFVNAQLREGKYASNAAVQAYVDAAQHGLSKLPAYVGPVTRGVRWLPHGTTIDQFLARYQVGSVVEEHSFLSTARGTDAVYHGPVYFKINSKTGRDVDWLSKFSGGEKEVLMMPGTRLHITKVEKNSQGKWIIHADEVL